MTYYFIFTLWYRARKLKRLLVMKSYQDSVLFAKTPSRRLANYVQYMQTPLFIKSRGTLEERRITPIVHEDLK